jgi:hypothetical protein
MGIGLYWVPLGAGDHVVRLGGFAFEAIAARLASRRRLDLYHAALEVRTPTARFVIEVAPGIWGAEARAARGVVAEGPVGSRLAGRVGLFRYELRCWRDGRIVDAEHAVASPVQISDEPGAAGRLLDLVPFVPMCTWGRDELGLGEMWTSNSVISWLILRAGAWSADLRPPADGRAPGWDAGLRIASRQEAWRPPAPLRQPAGRSAIAATAGAGRSGVESPGGLSTRLRDG